MILKRWFFKRLWNLTLFRNWQDRPCEHMVDFTKSSVTTDGTDMFNKTINVPVNMVEIDERHSVREFEHGQEVAHYKIYKCVTCGETFRGPVLKIDVQLR